jgi:pyruvate/2-oxoglutarate dehydrogenase complex dihydrolipoamide acyltransferase (E2) component
LLVDIVVPKWGMTMEEAVLLMWLKAVGDQVDLDDAVAEIETDKTTGEVVSPASGILTEIVVAAGAQVEPGQIIGRVRSAGD